MFCGILPWTWFSSSLLESSELADRRRQPDQEGAVPRRGAADRQRAGEHGALLPRACRSWSAFLIYYQHWPDPAGPAVVSGRRCWSSWCSRSALALILSALTVHFRDITRHPGEPADAVVLRHADHLSVVAAERAAVHSAASTSTRSRTSPSRTRRSCSSTGRSATGNGCSALGGGVDACCSSPATGCSIACATRSRRRCDAARSSSSTSRRSTAATAAAVRDAEERAAAAQHPARSAAERDVPGARPTCRSPCRRAATYGVIGRNGSGKSTALKLRRRHHQADQRHASTSTAASRR